MPGQQYEKACNKCGDIILMQKTGEGWKALNKDFTPHKCNGGKAPAPAAGAIIGLLTGYNSGSATFRVRGGATKTFALHPETFKAWQTAGYGPDQWIEFSVDAQGFIQAGARNVPQPDWGDVLKDPTNGEIKTPDTHNPAPVTDEQPKNTPCTSSQAAQPAPASKRLDHDLLISMVNNPDTYWRAKTLMDVEAHGEIRRQVEFKNWTEAINSAISLLNDGVHKPTENEIFVTAGLIHDFITGKVDGGVQ